MSGLIDESTEELNTELTRRYLHAFETMNVSDLGLSACRIRIDDLFAARDRVTTYFTMTYTHDRTGQDVVMTGLKSYKFRGGKIVEFWGETDAYGFLRQLGKVPEEFPEL